MEKEQQSKTSTINAAPEYIVDTIKQLDINDILDQGYRVFEKPNNYTSTLWQYGKMFEDEKGDLYYCCLASNTYDNMLIPLAAITNDAQNVVAG